MRLGRWEGAEGNSRRVKKVVIELLEETVENFEL